MKAPKPTEVCITVDTEFSIGGNFENPLLSPVAEPVVLGAVDGKEHGLGFLLDSFAEFGMRATFFVEALQTAYFGDEPMGRIATRIVEAGQDAQLHLHPCWLHYKLAEKRASGQAPNDSCAGRTDVELDRFFRTGLSAFSRWGIPRPVAVRPGNFQVDVTFYRAAVRFGLVLSSSIALAVRRPSDKSLWVTSGRHRIGRILELPVFSYNFPFGNFPFYRDDRLRALTITGSTLAEMLEILQQARDLAISPVIILTHPQEFIKRRDFRYATLRRNRVNQSRLRGLLQFLSQNRDDFRVLPISEITDDGSHAASPRNPAISASFGNTIARMIENGMNDRIWWY